MFESVQQHIRDSDALMQLLLTPEMEKTLA
jgi:hypothetical protein